MSVYIQYICTRARNGEHNEKKRKHQIRKTSRTGGFSAPREPSMQDKTRQDKTNRWLFRTERALDARPDHKIIELRGVIDDLSDAPFDLYNKNAPSLF